MQLRQIRIRGVFRQVTPPRALGWEMVTGAEHSSGHRLWLSKRD
jgi:hypothetical protein